LGEASARLTRHTSFDFASVFVPGTTIDAFVPYPLSEETNRRGNTMPIAGRLKPGATLASAQAEFTLLGKQLEREHPERNNVRSIGPGLRPPVRENAGSMFRRIWPLAGLTGRDLQFAPGKVDILQKI